jgi:HEAT repeat protein
MRARRSAALAAVLLVLCLLVPTAARANGWEHAAIPFKALIRGLGEEAAETRARAAESLGFRGQVEAVAFLLKALRAPESDHAVRRALYTALGRLGDRAAVPDLHACLDKESREEMRGACVQALAAIGDPESLPMLLRALQEDRHPLIQARLVTALGRFPQPASIRTLTALLTGDSEPAVRLAAIRSLGETGAESALEPLLAALASADADERAIVVEALGRLGHRGATEPLTKLLDRSEEPALRSRIVIALAALRDGGAYPVLVGLLADEVPAVRFYAVRGLRELGQPEAAGPLVSLYQDLAVPLETPETIEGLARLLAAISLQVEVLRALTELDPAKGLPAFLDAAGGSAPPRNSQTALRIAEALYERRRVALYGLGYTGSPEAGALLAGPAGLDDEDPRLRATAVRSLGVLGLGDAVGQVLPMLEDEAAEVRWTAAMVLGRLADSAAAAPLAARLSDRHGEVRRQAALALGYLGDTRMRETLLELADDDPSQRVREAASFAAGVLQGPN